MSDLSRTSVQEASPPSTVSGAVRALAVVNLLIGGFFVAWGVYIIVAGADFARTLIGASSEGANVLGSQGGAQLKQAGDTAGGVIGAIVAALGICMMLQGAPMLLTALGLWKDRGWGRVFAYLLAVLCGLQALGCLSNLKNTPNLIGLAVLGGYCVLTFGILLTQRRAVVA